MCMHYLLMCLPWTGPCCFYYYFCFFFYWFYYLVVAIILDYLMSTTNNIKQRFMTLNCSLVTLSSKCTNAILQLNINHVSPDEIHNKRKFIRHPLFLFSSLSSQGRKCYTLSCAFGTQSTNLASPFQYDEENIYSCFISISIPG